MAERYVKIDISWFDPSHHGSEASLKNELISAGWTIGQATESELLVSRLDGATFEQAMADAERIVGKRLVEEFELPQL